MIGTADTRGGAAKLSWNLGNELIKRGHQVSWIVRSKYSDSPLVYPTQSAVNTFFGHIRAFITSNDIDYGLGSNLLNHPWYRQADIIHAHNLHGNYFHLDTLRSIDNSKKLVWTLHDAWSMNGKCALPNDPTSWEGGYHPCVNKMAYPPMISDNTKYLWNKKRKIYKQLHNIKIISPSRWLDNMVKDSILSHLPHQVINNGINKNIFSLGNKLQSRKKLCLPINKKIILLVGQGGRNNSLKGWQYLENISKHPRFSKQLFLTIGGKKHSTSNILGVGQINHSQLSAYYQAADLLLLPSLVENFPLVAIESMACGLPVVAFNIGGIPEIITHKKNGYLAKYKEEQDLVKGISWIFAQTDRSLEMIKKRNRAKLNKQYSLSKMTDQYERVYHS